MSKVFISYSHADQVEAEVVHATLAEAEYDVVFDREIAPGLNWRDWLQANIQSAAIVVVLWSKNSAEGNWVRAEAELAGQNTVLLPLIIDDLPEKNIPFGFGERQWLRCAWCTKSDGRRELAAETRSALLKAMEMHLGTVTPIDAALRELQETLTQSVASQYCDVELVGTGRMSVVFKAAQKELGGTIALRVTPIAGILLLPNYVDEFQKGIKVAQELNHTNILDVRELHIDRTIAYTVMQYVDGTKLSDFIDSGPHSLIQIKQIALQLAEALAFAHANNVVHCNLSPHSVLVDKSNHVFVCDFGLAHASRLHTGGSTNATLFPNPSYMSPEQCLGEPITPRTDQYLLGLLLYELLTGAAPFQGASSYQLMRQHCQSTPPPIAHSRPECPGNVAATVLRLMEKDPLKRFQFTSEVVKAIASWPGYETLAMPVVPQSREDLMQAVASAKRSLDHASCVGEPYQGGSLYVEFYRQLMEDPRIAPYLSRLNFDRQVRMLGTAVTALLDFPLRSDEMEPQLARIAQAHAGLNLPRDLFETFVSTLARVVVSMDPTLNDLAARESLRKAWEVATLPGLNRLIALTQPTSAYSPENNGAEIPATERDSGLRLAIHRRETG